MALGKQGRLGLGRARGARQRADSRSEPDEVKAFSLEGIGSAAKPLLRGTLVSEFERLVDHCLEIA